MNRQCTHCNKNYQLPLNKNVTRHTFYSETFCSESCEDAVHLKKCKRCGSKYYNWNLLPENIYCGSKCKDRSERAFSKKITGVVLDPLEDFFTALATGGRTC